jgi:hypothetical protein
MVTKEVQNSRYEFRGENIGVPLAKWLNGPSHTNWTQWIEKELWKKGNKIPFSGNEHQDSQGRGRIVQLLSILQDLTSRWEFIHKSCKGKMTPADSANLQDLRASERKANRMLHRYSSRLQIDANEPFWRRGTAPSWFHGEQPFVWAQTLVPAQLQEGWAVGAIQTLSRQARLGYLKRCDLCRKFFFATKHFGIFCSAQCRARRYESNHYKNSRRKTKGI